MATPESPNRPQPPQQGIDRTALICVIAIVAMTFFTLVWATTLVAD